MKLGTLVFEPAVQRPELLAPTTSSFVSTHPNADIGVAPIDANLADTAAFCEAYDVALDVSANCVIVEAKRAERTWYAACMVLATTRADVNSKVRRALDARKISFASMETATALSAMEFGGITPLGLPGDWPVFVDDQVMSQDHVIVGSGIRGSKLLLNTNVFRLIPGAVFQSIVR